MIIYKATNILNNKCYIGQTINSFRQRIYCHKHNSKKPKLYFHRAIRKYGFDNFTWEILCECDSKEELDEMEFHYIKQYHSLSTDNGYNITQGFGNTTTGLKLTDEQLKAMSLRNTGTLNPNYGNGAKITGDINPSKRPEVREKIRQSKLGKPRPDIESYISKCYLIVNINTNKEVIIHNLSKWVRNNSQYNMTGIKHVLTGKKPNHYDIWIKRID